jgi:hypothetical protein
MDSMLHVLVARSRVPTDTAFGMAALWLLLCPRENASTVADKRSGCTPTSVAGSMKSVAATNETAVAPSTGLAKLTCDSGISSA